MKFKRIMLITLVLLAVLTIGAVSAADAVASDDLAVSDEGDSIEAPVDDVDMACEPDDNDNLGEMDENDIDIEVQSSVSKEETGDNFTTISVSEREGNFVICTGEGEGTVELYRENLAESERYTQDENEDFCFGVSLNDIDNYIAQTIDAEKNFYDVVQSGDNVRFVFVYLNQDFVQKSYIVDFTDDSITFTDEDVADGVIINVPDGDEKEYNLDDDLDVSFAFVSVRNDLDGKIVILVRGGEEGDQQEFFAKKLDEITNTEPDPDNDGFTIYKISLNDVGNYNDLLDCENFELAFVNDDGDKVDSRNYDIDYDEDDNTVAFWESEEEEEEMHGVGEEIYAEFSDANIMTNGIVVTISKDDLPEDADNEFTLIMPQEDDEPREITLKLDEIEEGDNYVIRVNDLQLPEFKERYDILMILQFYKEGEEAYYAEMMDDEEPITIYESPCIFNETSLLGDDDVITIQEVPEGVDEFTVTSSKEGSQDIVKTFKFSELVEDWEDVWVAFKLADLGITEVGDYVITVKYSDDLTYSGNLSVNKNVDIRTHEEDDEGGLKVFDSVDMLVVNFRISESVTGYVKIYVNESQVGENRNLADLPMGGHEPDDGRQIVLNDLNITESGQYKIKVELYDDADELLGETEFDLLVEVGESSVEIQEDSYPYGTEATDEIINYKIGAPLAEGQYFNIYFNGVKAGVITGRGLEFNDEFTVPMFDVLLFKPGNYNVNVTFFDGETESDVTNGSFSINELTLRSDKDVYIFEEDSVIISFDADSLEDDDEVRAYYVYDWGPVGRDDDMVFNPYGGNQMKEDGLYNDGVVSFDVAWITDEEGNVHFRLDEGTTLIYVVYRHGEVRFGGFIEVNVVKAFEPVDPALTVSVTNVTEGEAAVITVTTNASFSGNVTVKIENTNYTVAVVNGTGSLPVSGLAVGNYTAVATFAATEVFSESVKNTTFTVKAKIATKISAPAITTTFGTSKDLVVTLTDANGNALANKKVTVVLNGVKKELTTDAKGQVKFAIGTNLAAKVYTATFAFDGDAGYAKISGSAKVTVNKAKTKIVAKKKTFKKSKKAKKYTITLKAGNKAVKKVKVTITGKFKGKKIKITKKTNNKGKATFNLKKLTQKGKFKATIKFNGSKNYEKATKKVKITIK